MSSAIALADAGVQAVSAGQYADGIAKLTQALKAHAAPLWYLERSRAYLRTNQFDLALYDAEMALRIAYDRANRDLMMEAQMRRAITLFRIGRFADADVCAFWAIRLSDGAKAREDDGQQNKVDHNGDYVIRVKEVQEEARPQRGDGLATALNAASKRTKESSLRNQAYVWRIKALSQMEKLPEGHDGRKLHLPIKYPEPSQTSTTSNASPASSARAVADNADGGETSSTINTPNATSGRDAWEKIWAQYQTLYMKHKIRCSFYQTDTSLTVDVFLKNLSQEQVTIDSDSQAIKLSPVQGASLGSFGGSIVLLLFDEIQPDVTKYNVKSMKIELVLQKQRAGKWPALRRKDADIVDNLSVNPSQGIPFNQFFDFITHLGYKDVRDLELPDVDSDPSAWYVALLEKLRSNFDNERGPLSVPEIAASIPSGSSLPPKSKDTVNIEGSAKKAIPPSGQESRAPKTSGGAPTYPTSSKNGPKNWDSIDDGDDEDVAKNGDVNDFFQQIYKDADEDTKRAMMKSFVESNGTALSTSWADTKGKNYNTQPPDGVEAKKWD
ncbi:hypothetical protein E0Z10_g8246 [Xylaria hypoxylon]|uniref:CS domain-containing protein n=1 Tax=Xylaria hypoxylon TaxID=37992 RepID=A0A4Z0YK96_9PEZI|nr:hypothetical protein E0Z10_g8246 [Xylaria hypoxylon]